MGQIYIVGRRGRCHVYTSSEAAAWLSTEAQIVGQCYVISTVLLRELGTKLSLTNKKVSR